MIAHGIHSGVNTLEHSPLVHTLANAMLQGAAYSLDGAVAGVAVGIILGGIILYAATHNPNKKDTVIPGAVAAVCVFGGTAIAGTSAWAIYGFGKALLKSYAGA
jgi:ABC-type amino acid transport system permease subunit